MEVCSPAKWQLPWRSRSTTHVKENNMDLFKPRGASAPRNPTDNNQKNGQIINTPRYSEFGGLTASNKAGSKNMMSMSKPGDTKKVI